MPKTIMLIINSPQIGSLIYDFLSQFGYQVKTCLDGRSALNQARAIQPNLVICERAPVGNTSQHLANIFKQPDAFPTIPFITLAPRESDDIPRDSVIDDVLCYPFSETELYGIVTKWIESGIKVKTIQTAPPKLQKQSPALPKEELSKPKLISCRTISELLFSIASEKKTGLIKVRGKRRKINLVVQTGKIVSIRSNYIREDSFGRFLLESEMITKQEQKSSFEKAKDRNIKHGEMLNRLGILSHHEVETLLSQHKAAKALKLFSGSWDSEKFRFEPINEDRIDNNMEPIPVSHLLREGIMRIAPTINLLKQLDTFDADTAVIELKDNFSQVAKLLALNDVSIAKANTLNGMSLLKARETFGKDLDDTYRLLFLLVITDSATIIDCAPGVKFPEKKQIDDISTRIIHDIQAQPENTSISKALYSKDPVLFNSTRIAARSDALLEKKLNDIKTFYENKDFMTASKMLESFINIKPDHPEALTMLGWSKFNLNPTSIQEIKDAKQLLEIALKLDDTSAITHLYLGKVLRCEQNDSLAYGEFAKAHFLDPNHPEIVREIQTIKNKQN